MESKHTVFVDLDNTLISAHFLEYHQPQNTKLITLGSGDDIKEMYYGRLRPGAIEFLRQLRAQYNVYLLTNATLDYAQAWNEEFQLGFDNMDIFAREHTDSMSLNTKHTGLSGKAVLIDDLLEKDFKSRKKLKWIETHGAKPKYYKINMYDHRTGKHFTPEFINEVLNAVENQLV